MALEKQKYEHVLEAIEAGGATKEGLMTLLEAKSAGVVTTQIKFINVLGKYPVEGEDGVYVVLNAEEFEEHLKNTSGGKDGGPKWTKDPQAKRLSLESRLATKITRMNTAKKKLDNNPDDKITQLRHTIAQCEFHIANIQVNEFQANMLSELKITAEQYKAGDLDQIQAALKPAPVEATPAE